MKILFISDNFPPEVNAPAARTSEHCKEWVNQGLQVTVITCFPNYPQGKIYAGYKNKLYKKEIIENLTVIRVWTYMAANEGFFKRILDYVSFAVMSFLVGLAQKTDIIVATSPQFFTTVTAYSLSIFKKKPWVFELRDLWPDSIKAVSAIEQKSILSWLEKLELFLYKKADSIIAVTDAFKQNLVARGIKAEKIKVVTNGANLELFSPTKDKNLDLLNKYDLENKFIVAYIGTHGMTHGLGFVIESIKHISDENIHFLFIGDGADKKNIVWKSQELYLSNILFLPAVSREQIPAYISVVDIALVPLKKRDTFKTVIPSKIFEFAAMQKPILLGVQGQAQKIIEEYRIGLCFEPENKESFIENLLLLKNNKKLYRACQHGCKKLTLHYDRKKLAIKMLDCLKELYNAPK